MQWEECHVEVLRYLALHAIPQRIAVVPYMSHR